MEKVTYVNNEGKENTGYSPGIGRRAVIGSLATALAGAIALRPKYAKAQGSIDTPEGNYANFMQKLAYSISASVPIKEGPKRGWTIQIYQMANDCPNYIVTCINEEKSPSGKRVNPRIDTRKILTTLLYVISPTEFVWTRYGAKSNLLGNPRDINAITLHFGPYSINNFGRQGPFTEQEGEVAAISGLEHAANGVVDKTTRETWKLHTHLRVGCDPNAIGTIRPAVIDENHRTNSEILVYNVNQDEVKIGSTNPSRELVLGANFNYNWPGSSALTLDDRVTNFAGEYAEVYVPKWDANGFEIEKLKVNNRDQKSTSIWMP